MQVYVYLYFVINLVIVISITKIGSFPLMKMSDLFCHCGSPIPGTEEAL